MYESYRPQGFSLLPPVVKNLLIINVILFLATYVFDKVGITIPGFDNFSDALGLHFFSAEKFKPYQLTTYMFMHGGIGHIFFNMLALWMFGVALENLWGPKKFLAFYLICGFGAAITHYAIFYFESKPILDAVNNFIANPNFDSVELTLNYLKPLPHSEETEKLQAAYDSIFKNNVNISSSMPAVIDFFQQYKTLYLNAPVVVGASGAIFGILLAFGYTFPNTVLYIQFLIPLKAKYFVFLYAGIELAYAIANKPGDNVAHFAHLGGMLFGFILLRVWKMKSHKGFE